MVQAIININEYQDRILNIVKGKFGLKNKSESVNLIIDKFGEELLEPELRPEYVKRLDSIKKQKGIKFISIEELKAHIKKNA